MAIITNNSSTQLHERLDLFANKRSLFEYGPQLTRPRRAYPKVVHKKIRESRVHVGTADRQNAAAI